MMCCRTLGLWNYLEAAQTANVHYFQHVPSSSSPSKTFPSSFLLEKEGGDGLPCMKGFEWYKYFHEVISVSGPKHTHISPNYSVPNTNY